MDTNRATITVGIDYGTTQSCFSYRFSDGKSSMCPRIAPDWPGCEVIPPPTVPTLVAYPEENFKNGAIKWGFLVQAGMKSVAWTKLRLDPTVDLRVFSDDHLRDALPIGIMRLPNGKSAQQVVTDYLRGLFQVICTTLERERLSNLQSLQNYDVEFRFGVPAVWDNCTLTSFRTAVGNAGFLSLRGPDNRPSVVFYFPEPDLVLSKVLADNSLRDHSTALFQPGDGIVVCDLGGGTIDIASYQIGLSESPGVYTQLSKRTGGLCGATSIDRSLHQWMRDTFGVSYTRVPLSQRGHGSTFAQSFEEAKKEVSATNSDQTSFRLPIGPGIVHPDPSIFDQGTNSVILSLETLRGFFRNVVTEICDMIHAEMEKVAEQAGGIFIINRLILTGGFSLSQYVRDEIENSFGQTGQIAIDYLSDPLMTIADGAVEWGLHPPFPTGRLCYRHYGISLFDQFDPNCDLEANMYFDHFKNQRMSKGVMFWSLHKNTPYPEGHEITETVCLPLSKGRVSTKFFHICSCDADEAPRHEKAQGVKFLAFLACNLVGLDFNFFESRTVNTQVFYNVVFNFKFYYDGDTIQVTALVNNAQVGRCDLKITKE